MKSPKIEVKSEGEWVIEVLRRSPSEINRVKASSNDGRRSGWLGTILNAEVVQDFVSESPDPSSVSDHVVSDVLDSESFPDVIALNQIISECKGTEALPNVMGSAPSTPLGLYDRLRSIQSSCTECLTNSVLPFAVQSNARLEETILDELSKKADNERILQLLQSLEYVAQQVPDSILSKERTLHSRIGKKMPLLPFSDDIRDGSYEGDHSPWSNVAANTDDVSWIFRHYEDLEKRKAFFAAARNQWIEVDSIVDQEGITLEADGERQLHCSKCTRSFTTPHARRRHFRTHFKLKPYVCKYCAHQFTRLDSLGLHERVHHGRK